MTVQAVQPFLVSSECNAHLRRARNSPPSLLPLVVLPHTNLGVIVQNHCIPQTNGLISYEAAVETAEDYGVILFGSRLMHSYLHCGYRHNLWCFYGFHILSKHLQHRRVAGQHLGKSFFKGVLCITCCTFGSVPSILDIRYSTMEAFHATMCFCWGLSFHGLSKLYHQESKELR
jgi:hypothetical protein